MDDERIQAFLDDPYFAGNTIFVKTIEPREGLYADLPAGLDPEILRSLGEKGISRLYAHQEESYRAIKKGENIVIVTPTASGKTLCYNLPVTESLKNDKNLKAMYIFPTKALAQDQTAELNMLLANLGDEIRTFVYDGDTPASVRMSARTDGRIIITNPDMLHSGILPNHTKWVKLFEKLQYIVIDELHYYRGIFGSHISNLFRRLKRICEFYNSKPAFICCSATIANPLELAEKMFEEKFTLINKNGAPSGRRYFVFYNPPIVNRELGLRRGVVLESTKIAGHFFKKGIQSIIFTRSRINTELILSYMKKRFEKDEAKIAGYRGGYLPGERRAVEKGVKRGEILCVVSTNALELGIDIGSLDVSILAGYPGSVASTWQQAGRAGRKGSKSLSILVSSAAPLDQFMITNPSYFFGTHPEAGIINPDNIYVLTDHIKCAAFELPFAEGKPFGKRDITEILEYLERKDVLHREEEKYYWTESSYPAENISLRTAESGNFVIINTTKNKDEVIGEMDRTSVPYFLFEGAIYMHGSAQYKVAKLDYEGRKAYVEEADVNYYTDAIAKTDIKPLDVFKESRRGRISRIYGEILVRTLVPKFKKIKFDTHENIGYGDINLPEEQMHTHSVSFLFDEDFFGEMQTTERQETLLSLAYLLENIAPLYLLCDIRDIRCYSNIKDTNYGKPALFVYDRYPGGIGLAERIYDIDAEVFKSALDLVAKCPCPEGCPSCIGPHSRSGIKAKVLSCLRDMI
ncbi:MAG: ATP-dependent helicase [Lentisphaerae bacterium GWF2_52_8]|nr:MAG: ATP-dependent helicase [Lentisphaerae bacterium GWF2_52_8]